MLHPSITITVDAQLHWVVRVPEVLAGAPRPSSSAQLASLGAEFDAMQPSGPAASELLGSWRRIRAWAPAKVIAGHLAPFVP